VVVVKLIPSIRAADALALLNLKPVDPATPLQIQSHYGEFAPSPGGSGGDLKELSRRLGVSKPGECGLRIIATQLRRCVDEWLWTGLSDDGSEALELRSLSRAPLAMKALKDYASKQDLRLRFHLAQSEFVVELGFSENAPQAIATSQFVDPIERAWCDVARLFFGLVTSDWGSRLCKCRYKLCGRYFVHAKPRRSYKHGTFCGDHQMAWTATQQVMRSRHLIRSALLNFAATQLMKRHVDGPHWQGDKQTKIQLANDISARIRANALGTARVGLTWVTRNRQEIEKHRLKLCSSLLDGGSVAHRRN
jgi:hypothetical protein